MFFRLEFEKETTGTYEATSIFPKRNGAVLTENVHRVCKNIWFLYDCVLYFHVCFAFMFPHMYTFIWYQTCKSSEHLKTEFQYERSKNGVTYVTVKLVT